MTASATQVDQNETIPTKSDKRKDGSHVVVRPQNFNSRIAYDLVLALDQELAVMYPDWDDLVHPNLNANNHNPNHKDSLLKEDTPRPVIDMDDSTNDDGNTESRLEGTSHDGTANYKALKFFVAFDERPSSDNSSEPPLPVGCVALNPLLHFPAHHAPAGTLESQATTKEPPTVELKRMYVVPAYRGSGVATKLLLYAMEYARTQMGMHRLVLETGIRQGPSVALYERHQFAYRDMFGDWVGAGPDDGGVSVCMEKWLV